MRQFVLHCPWANVPQNNSAGNRPNRSLSHRQADYRRWRVRGERCGRNPFLRKRQSGPRFSQCLDNSHFPLVLRFSNRKDFAVREFETGNIHRQATRMGAELATNLMIAVATHETRPGAGPPSQRRDARVRVAPELYRLLPGLQLESYQSRQNRCRIELADDALDIAKTSGERVQGDDVAVTGR